MVARVKDLFEHVRGAVVAKARAQRTYEIVKVNECPAVSHVEQTDQVRDRHALAVRLEHRLQTEAHALGATFGTEPRRIVIVQHGPEGCGSRGRSVVEPLARPPMKCPLG